MDIELFFIQLNLHFAQNHALGCNPRESENLVGLDQWAIEKTFGPFNSIILATKQAPWKYASLINTLVAIDIVFIRMNVNKRGSMLIAL